MIRNNLKMNNMNITLIMNNSTISKAIVFDKILINTYNRCMNLMNLEKADYILSIDNITNYHPIDDNYISIDPRDYVFNSVPSFSESDRKILNIFYGVILINY